MIWPGPGIAAKPPGPGTLRSRSVFFCSSVSVLSSVASTVFWSASTSFFCLSDRPIMSCKNQGSTWFGGGGPPGPGRPGPKPPLMGFTYFQTTCLSGVTSKSVPLGPEQMNVLPLGSRWAPEMKNA